MGEGVHKELYREDERKSKIDHVKQAMRICSIRFAAVVYNQLRFHNICYKILSNKSVRMMPEMEVTNEECSIPQKSRKPILFEQNLS
jgi:hypothetical protein